VNTAPTLDAEDQAILNALQPEGAVPGSPPGFGVSYGEQPAGVDTPAAPAAAPAADASLQQVATSPAPAPVAAAPAVTDPNAAAPAPAAAAPAPAASPAPAPAEPQGNVNKALRAARREARRLEGQMEQMRAELDRLKAGGAAAPAADPNDPLAMTEEQIAELEENFPTQAALVRSVRQLSAQVQQTQRAAAPAPAADSQWEPPVAPAAVQEVIDQVPTLLQWQVTEGDQPKFQMAVEYDTSLLADPLWKNRPAVERFSEAVRRTEAALASQAAASPATQRQDPNAVIAATPAAQPSGVSDFRGGGPASAPAIDFSRMTDEQILSALPVQP
jgi:hypothetical protein